MLDRLTRDFFEPRRGESFVLSSPREADGPRLELRLSDVRSNGLRGGDGRTQFSVHFRGPRDPILPQMIYRLENPGTGVLELFLVPIGRDDAGVIYEAVFT
jgi:hypothetical protein